ncbi:MAG TPA: threonine synthase [bacterium]|nr:threonine synthase [bacterium]
MPSHLGLVSGYTCVRCGRTYDATEHRLTCAVCGSEGTLDVTYDYDEVRGRLTPAFLAEAPGTHWRYLPLLPLPEGIRLPVAPVGWTPAFEAVPLAAHFGLRSILLKDDGRNPTASLKDRASSVGAAHAAASGYRDITCASTGNAASSLAGMAAQLGLQAYIFVPAQVSAAKLTQMLMYGATVFLVRGSYEDAFRLSMDAAARFGWYNRNSAINPLLVEGKKTVGLEIAEQTASAPPDVVVVPLGDGCTLAGTWKGLREMHLLGFSPRIPRVIGVQAAGAAPIAAAFAADRDVTSVPAQTMADGIAVGTPRNWRKALAAVRASDGTIVTVTDEEIADAMRLLARLTGVWGEPAALAGIAALPHLRDRGVIGPRERVLVLITGHGLKDPAAARRAAPGHAMEIEATPEAVQEAVR